MQPPQGQFVPPPPPPHFAPPTPPVKWYHQKWFVVIMLLVFFPVGLFLLWKSPVTKTSGRIVWTTLIALGVLIKLAGGSDVKPATNQAASTSTQPSSSSTSTPPKTASKPADPPKEEYPFKLTDKSSGKVYKGKTASNVGVAIMDVTTTKTVGTNQFAKKNASGGATFVVVRVGVSNDQKDAITMDGNLFKLLADGREYSYSTEAMTALMMDDNEGFFLKKINPGLVAVGSIAFEVPESIKLDTAMFQFRGGFTGKTDTVPLKPITE